MLNHAGGLATDCTRGKGQRETQMSTRVFNTLMEVGSQYPPLNFPHVKHSNHYNTSKETELYSKHLKCFLAKLFIPLIFLKAYTRAQGPSWT